jgi:8-oxo-dGTP diphosphatase
MSTWANPGPRAPVLAVGAVVHSEKGLLLIRRGREPGKGLWSIPGGRVETGEGPEEALKREVFEECHLEVEVGQLVGFVERLGEGYHFIILDYLAELRDRDSQPVAGDDADVAGFFSPAELGALSLVEGLADFLTEHRLI